MGIWLKSKLKKYKGENNYEEKKNVDNVLVRVPVVREYSSACSGGAEPCFCVDE